jgi:hypothetical protein
MASQVSKLNYVDRKLGAPTSGQQTTRIVYDTVVPGTQKTAEFFKNFAGKSLGQSNLTQGKLDSSESMVIKTITFMEGFTNSDLTPLGAAHHVVCSVVVGNQTVVKNLPVNFNQGITGQPFDRLHAAASTTAQGVPFNSAMSPTELRLLTDIVIPPQTDFYVRLETDGDFGANTLLCVLSGYGKIFSAGSSF